MLEGPTPLRKKIAQIYLAAAKVEACVKLRVMHSPMGLCITHQVLHI
jgi:hypothetical protein